jgi:ferredoxin
MYDNHTESGPVPGGSGHCHSLYDDLFGVVNRTSGWLKSASMRVRVDPDVCEGNAVCSGLVPEVFFVGESDEVTILASEIPPELAGRVRQAVASCPKMALLLDEDEPGGG